MATANFETALRSELRNLSRGDAPEPVADPAPAVESTSTEATPETAPESTSAAEVVPAEPSQAQDGSTPPAQPSPASDVPTTSTYDQWLKRYGDPEKAAQAAFETEQRLVALLKAQKQPQSEAQPAAETQPAKQQAAPEPIPATTPVVAPPPVAPAHPVTQTEATPDVEQQVAQQVAVDNECVALVSEYHALSDDITKLWTVDKSGRPTGGEIVKLDARIQALQQVLAPSEALKAAGLDVPELDPLTRESYERALLKAKLDRRDLVDQYTDLAARRQKVATDFNGRRNQFREHLTREAQARAEAEQKDAEINQKAETFERSWVAARAVVFQKLNVPAKQQERISKALQRAALAEPGPIEPEALLSFMEPIVQEQIEFGKEFHSEQMAEYARLKKADAQVATQAPSGEAAVAPASPQNHQNWEKRLQAELRARRTSR